MAHFGHSLIPSILGPHVVLGRHCPVHILSAFDLRVAHRVQVRLRIAQLQIYLLLLCSHDIGKVLTAATGGRHKVIYPRTLLAVVVVVVRHRHIVEDVSILGLDGSAQHRRFVLEVRVASTYCPNRILSVNSIATLVNHRRANALSSVGSGAVREQDLVDF